MLCHSRPQLPPGGPHSSSSVSWERVGNTASPALSWTCVGRSGVAWGPVFTGVSGGAGTQPWGSRGGPLGASALFSPCPPVVSADAASSDPEAPTPCATGRRAAAAKQREPAARAEGHVQQGRRPFTTLLASPSHGRGN